MSVPTHCQSRQTLVKRPSHTDPAGSCDIDACCSLDLSIFFSGAPVLAMNAPAMKGGAGSGSLARGGATLQPPRRDRPVAVSASTRTTTPALYSSRREEKQSRGSLPAPSPVHPLQSGRSRGPMIATQPAQASSASASSLDGAARPPTKPLRPQTSTEVRPPMTLRSS